jgi:hypothetical protein
VKSFLFVVVLVVALAGLPLPGLSDTVISGDDTATLSADLTDPVDNSAASPGTWDLVAQPLSSQPSEVLLDVPFFSQKDPAWYDDYLDGSPFKIGNSGCALTSLAMVADYYGYDTDPGRLNTGLTAAGGIDTDGIISDWSKVAQASGQKVKWMSSVPASWDTIDQELDDGYPVICSVTRPGWLRYLHYIVFIGKIGNSYYFLDPLDEQENTREWPFGKYEYAIDTNQSLEICRPNLPPTCSIELKKQGVPVAYVDIGEVFEIHTEDSVDDFALSQVRFSSDDYQDGTPTGQWTEWCAWSVSSGDWDEVSKTKAWSFPTGGNKEVWVELKDDGSSVTQGHASIAVHPGYAVIVAGEGEGHEEWSFNHAANNAYRTLRNLGFGDSHIYYLNSNRPQDVDGDQYHDDEVDMTASFANFRGALNEIKDQIGDSALFVLYLVGHGAENEFSFGDNSLHVSTLSNASGGGLLDGFSEKVRMLIVIESSYSGSFISASAGPGQDSISAENRIIITATHDDQERLYEDILRSSDRFWGNLNQGLDVNESFVRGSSLGGNSVWQGQLMWFGDEECSLLDDNGDKTGGPPYHLDKDGELAAATAVGGPGTESLELTKWYFVWKHSLGELRVYDSQNRVTGLVDGDVEEEIPDSIYNEQNDIVAISSPSDSYRYQVTSTGRGTYGLDIASIEGSQDISFTATDVPVALGTVHEYIIDWDALTRGEEGVTVQVDSDGDGTIDYTLTAGSVLTGDQFMPLGGCFIATAAYGTPMADDIQVLREFRDKYLLADPLGQALVDTYYRISPPVAEFITDHPKLKPVVRAGLMPAIAVSAIAVGTTPAEKTVTVCLLVLVSAAVATRARKRGRRGPEHTSL